MTAEIVSSKYAWDPSVTPMKLWPPPELRLGREPRCDGKGVNVEPGVGAPASVWEEPGEGERRAVVAAAMPAGEAKAVAGFVGDRKRASTIPFA